MPLNPDILRFFSDELCKLGAMPTLRVPGVTGRVPSMPGPAGKTNLAKFTNKTKQTPTTGSSPSGVNSASLKTVGTTTALSLPAPPSV